MANLNTVTSAAQDVVNNRDLSEGQITRKIEQQTAKIPSVGYLGLAVGSMVFSAVLLLASEKKEYGTFVGLWAPAFMLIGIYNKLVKLEGSDRFSVRGT